MALAAANEQLLLMVIESLFIAALLLFVFHLRRELGTALIYVVIGVIFQYSNVLAAGFYVQVTPSVTVSPGSIVLFPAVLFLVLLVYISEDALEARRLIYGVAIANVVMLPFGLLIARQLQLPLTINPYHLTVDLFTSQPRIAVVGTIVLFLDTVLICILYEVLTRWTKSLFLRVWLSSTLVLCFDSLAFVTGSFAGTHGYGGILYSQLVGKSTAGLIYAVALTIYLKHWLPGAATALTKGRGLGPTWRFLTYRQRYEELREAAIRDGLTEVYNRRFFDETLGHQMAMAGRSGRSVTMMMLDIDLFKNVNDKFGHLEGDQVLRIVAATLVSTLRSSDYVCRYGGEEFAVILPATDLPQGTVLAQRIVSRIPEACGDGWAGAKALPVTVTIGVAAYPNEAQDQTDLVRLADQRLYTGKGAGRNRAIGA
ncbi:MAG TPA: GGDEF domain-containing protein [Candidatus Cybelea sp.]